MKALGTPDIYVALLEDLVAVAGSLWVVSTEFTIDYARFIAGPFLRETPPGDHTRFFAAWITYKF